MSCAKCSDDFAKAREKLVCAECKGEFHPACTRVESVENFKKFSSQRKSTWKCDTCKLETASTSSRSDQDPATSTAILQSIKKMNDNLSAKIAEVNSNVSGIREELKDVRSTIGGMKNSIEELSVENNARKHEYEQVMKENIELKEGMEGLKIQLRNMEQYSRRDNIEISGIPYSKGENIYSVLKKISEAIEVKFDPWDVSVAHRLPARDDRRHPTIIVKFIARSCKEAWMNAAWERRKRLTGALLSDSWPSYPFYVNDHLTAFNKTILGRARELKKQRKVAHVWTRDCKVFARRTATPGCPATHLTSMADLENLIKDSQSDK